MRNLEFYIYEDELWCLFPDGRNEQVTEHSTELIKSILEEIREFHPEAYSDLMKWFRKSSHNVPYFQFLMVKQFCKCNFGNLDSTTKDIDRKGYFNFEHVPCPLRGNCPHENIVCNPKFNSRISDAEMRVMKMIYEGCSNEEVADKLYLSPHTVKNHIKSVYMKLGIHEKSEFVQYAHKNNLFRD